MQSSTVPAISKQTIQDLPLKGKRVLIRVDFNVPLDANQKITDDTRIRESLPTIKYALEQGAARVILMSHLGRPDGKSNPVFSLKPVADHLSKLLGRPVVQASDCIGPKVTQEIQAAPKDAVILLENLRFHAEEEKNEPNFVKALAANGDVYVNDAFGTSHRAHASVAGIVAHLPSGAGFLLEKEIKYLGEATKNPAKPFVLILGGAKVSDKIGLIENMIPKVDLIIIGGAMAYTFGKVTGYAVGGSKIEKDKIELAGEILKKAAAKGIKVMLPVDHVVVQEFREDAPFEIQEGIKDGWSGVDIGPKTTKIYAEALQAARTAVWNGPMGVFEMKNFKNGSLGVAQALAGNTNCVSIIGGGDTAACVTLFGLAPKMSHISTGGGASLEYLEGKKLPGIDLLPEKK